MLRASVLLLLAVPSVASAQNLVALDVDAPPVLVAGRAADFDVVLISDGTTPAFSGELLLVRNAQLSTAVTLAPFGPITAPAGLRQELTFSRTVPAGIDGAYQIAMRLDPAGAVTETNEFDNFVAKDTYLTVRAPAVDGVAVAVAPASNAVTSGATLDVDVTVRNGGEVGGPIDFAIVFSRDEVVDTGDIEIARSSVTLAPGAESTPTISATIPAAIPAGVYTVGVVIDPDGTIVEGVETDNTAVAPDPLTVRWDTLTLDTTIAPDPTLLVFYELYFVARGGDGAYDFAVTAGSLPDGLSLSSAGVLSGQPVRTGTFSFDVEVSSDGRTDTNSFSVQVHPTNAPIEIVRLDVLPAFRGLPYEQRFVAGGGEGPYVWSLEGGDLPPGMMFDEDGILSGTPTDIGTYDFEVRVVDFRDNTITASFSVDVIFASQVLVLTREPELVPFGGSVEVELQAIGGVGPYTWTALTPEPPGLELSREGTLSGTPTEVGEFKMRVRAADSTMDPSTDSALLTVVVEDDPAFRIVNGPLEPATVRARYEVVFEAEGGVEPLTWRLAPGSQTPDGFFLEAGDGEAAPVGTLRLYGVAFRETDQPFILRVVDGAGRRREAVFVLSARATSSGAGGSDGCQCTTAAPESGAPLLLGGLLLWWGRRRRRSLDLAKS
ncbi:MAG: putative Ig domain-containing protein [Deltaproteobacteria bacterium]